jgi:hypothetical protein
MINVRITPHSQDESAIKATMTTLAMGLLRWSYDRLGPALVAAAMVYGAKSDESDSQWFAAGMLCSALFFVAFRAHRRRHRTGPQAPARSWVESGLSPGSIDSKLDRLERLIERHEAGEIVLAIAVPRRSRTSSSTRASGRATEGDQ